MTAALCLYARDKAEVRIACQMPLYPMLDDRDTVSSVDNHTLVWNARRSHSAWKLYLRNIKRDVPIYAAPARAGVFGGLPLVYTYIGSKEPFYCETLAYIAALKNAGVEVKVNVYEDESHAFDIFKPFSRHTREAKRRLLEWIKYALDNYFAGQDN